MKDITYNLATAAIIAAVVAILLISGCSQQKQQPPAATQPPQEQQAQPPMMEMRNVSLCDLNADGLCDAADLAIFHQALGKHRGDLSYHPLADADADGVVTATDEQILFPVTTPADKNSIAGEPVQEPGVDHDIYKDNLDQSLDELSQL